MGFPITASVCLSFCGNLILFAISIFDYKWLNALLYLLFSFLFLITMHQLKWHLALFHAAVLTAVMSMCELPVYSIIRHFAPNFFTEATRPHNIILFAVFSTNAAEYYAMLLAQNENQSILIHYMKNTSSPLPY